MTLAEGQDSPRIGRVVLLADQSAHYLIAGLAQLDRLFRTLEECFATALDQGRAPEVVVVWQTPGLLEQRETRLPVSHRIEGQSIAPSSAGDTLLLRTNVVFRRGVLARLLRAGEPHAAFAIVGSDAFPERVAAREHALQDTDGSAWVLGGPGDIREVERQLVRTTGKPSDGLVSRTLNRPISRLLSRWLLQTRITPNQISYVVLGVLAAGTATLTLGTPEGFVIGMLLFHLASVLDGCDGEIARVKFLESRRGAWLDTSVDLLGNFLLPLAIAVGLSRQALLPAALGETYLIEGVLTALGIAIGIFGVARVRPAGRADFNDFGSTAIARFKVPRRISRVLQGFANVLRRDSYVLLFVCFAVLGAPELILHFLALGIAVHLPVIAWSWWMSARVAAPLKAPDRF